MGTLRAMASNTKTKIFNRKKNQYRYLEEMDRTVIEVTLPTIKGIFRFRVTTATKLRINSTASRNR